VEAIYMGEKSREASVGDFVMTEGNVRAIVIAVNGISVKIVGVKIDKTTGDSIILNPLYIHDLPASQCHYSEKQALNR